MPEFIRAPLAGPAALAGTGSPVRPPHGGLDRSTVASPIAVVWGIGHALLAADPNVRRCDLVRACERAGVAHWTARTQVNLFLKAYRPEGGPKGPRAPAAPYSPPVKPPMTRAELEQAIARLQEQMADVTAE